MFDVYKFILLFAIYSFCGWIFEVIVVAISTKKFSNRGFLIGPICPIYGVSSLIMILLLSKYEKDYFILFCMSFFICTVIEYFTSFIMEKLFKTRWWDYSHKKFNLNGRICLQNSIFFGLFGVLIIIYINKFFSHLINLLNSHIICIISIMLLIVILIDFVISFNIINKIKNVTNNVLKDNTVEINEKVKSFIKHNSLLYKRVFKAFPNLNLSINIKNLLIRNKK